MIVNHLCGMAKSSDVALRAVTLLTVAVLAEYIQIGGRRSGGGGEGEV